MYKSRTTGDTHPKPFAKDPVAACKRAAELLCPLPNRLRKVPRLVRKAGRFTVVVHLFLVIPVREGGGDRG